MYLFNDILCHNYRAGRVHVHLWFISEEYENKERSLSNRRVPVEFCEVFLGGRYAIALGSLQGLL